MGKKGIETLVGLFVLLGIAGLMFLALKAANLASFSSGDTYTVYGSDGAALTFSCREIAPGRWRVAQGNTVSVVTACLHGGMIEIDTAPGRLVFRPTPPLAFAGADAVADRAVFLEKGRVRFDGPARDLLERDDLARAVFLGGEGRG